MSIEDKLNKLSQVPSATNMGAGKAAGDLPTPNPPRGLSTVTHSRPTPALGSYFQTGAAVSDNALQTPTSSITPDLAEDGFRGWLNRTFPFLNIARTEDEVEREAWRMDMNANVHPAKVIGIVSPNGSTGKSSTTQLIGSTLAKNRAAGGVCAMDIDASSILATRMRPSSVQTERKSVANFVAAIREGLVTTLPKANSFFITNKEKLNVLPGVSYSGHDPITADELWDVLNTLYDYQNLILVDFPGSREVPVAEAALGWLDAMVFVVETNHTSLNSGYHMLEQISRSHPSLLERTIILLNNRSGGPVLPDLEEARSQLANKIHATGDSNRIFRIDNDSHVYESGPLELSKCEEDTQRDFEKVAAALMRVVPTSGEPKFKTAQPQ